MSYTATVPPTTREDINFNRITPRTLTETIINFHGSVFDPEQSPDAPEIVMAFGPPGLGKSRAGLSGCVEIAKTYGLKPRVIKFTDDISSLPPNPDPDECLILYMSMAGQTTMSIGGPIAIKEDANFDRLGMRIPPEVWQRAAKFENVVYFLDELPHMISPETLFSLFSEGRYGETRLAARSLVLCAGNEGGPHRSSDFVMPAPELNRMAIYYMRGDAKEWKEDFALGAGVHPACVAFAQRDAYRAYFEDFMAESWDSITNFPSFRSLTKLSDSINHFQRRQEKLHSTPEMDIGDQVYAGNVIPEDALRVVAFGRLGNTKLADEFVTFYKSGMEKTLPEIRSIFNGKGVSSNYATLLSSDGVDAAAECATFTSYICQAYLQIVTNVTANPRYENKEKTLLVATDRLLKGISAMQIQHAQIAIWDILAAAEHTPEMKVVGEQLRETCPGLNAKTAIHALVTKTVMGNPEYTRFLSAISESKKEFELAEASFGLTL